jgi:hypothetical protein
VTILDLRLYAARGGSVIVAGMPPWGPAWLCTGVGPPALVQLEILVLVVRPAMLGRLMLGRLAGAARGQADHHEDADRDTDQEEHEDEDGGQSHRPHRTIRTPYGSRALGGVMSRRPTPVSRRTPRAVILGAWRVSEYCRSSRRTASATIAMTPIVSPAPRLTAIATTTTMGPITVSRLWPAGQRRVLPPVTGVIAARYVAGPSRDASDDACPLAPLRQGGGRRGQVLHQPEMGGGPELEMRGGAGDVIMAAHESPEPLRERAVGCTRPSPSRSRQARMIAVSSRAARSASSSGSRPPAGRRSRRMNARHRPSGR